MICWFIFWKTFWIEEGWWACWLELKLQRLEYCTNNTAVCAGTVLSVYFVQINPCFSFLPHWKGLPLAQLFASSLAVWLFPHSTSEKHITKASENPVLPLWHNFHFVPSILNMEFISFLKEPCRMPWRSKYFRLFQRTVFILSSQDVMSFQCPSRSLLFLVVVVCAGDVQELPGTMYLIHRTVL